MVDRCLWQSEGQLALETAKVCLINGTSTGCEILKDLVLPGIGSFTVVDNKIVEGSDVGITFFLDTDCIGKNRAESVTQLLQELNEDVKGYYLSEDPITLIETRPEYFLQFSLVIMAMSGVNEKQLLKLADTLWKAKIPLVVVQSVGFIGYFRIVLPEHTIVETHPENAFDLRLDVPFPTLEGYVNNINFDTQDSKEHGHIPYVAILLKYLNEWKKNHNGEFPKTYAEKNEFKQLINNCRLKHDEENFDEALANAWKACTITKIPSHVEKILDDPSCENLTSESTNFWIIARAVRDFIDNEGQHLLPLSGSLPDMKADTAGYVELQNIYRKKAKEDFAIVRSNINKILSSIGRSSDSISDDQVENFCKNAAHIKVIRYRSLQEEYINDPKKNEIEQWLEDSDNNIVYYILIRAINRFYEIHNRYPDAETFFIEIDSSEYTEQARSEFDSLKTIVIDLLRECDITNIPDHLDNYIHEICRAGGSELPNIAALLGGLVSQEIIKLITHQYIPMENTSIFDGTKSTASTFVL
nr:3211_t:CDS:10 [Entrophospora candida]